jgi:hypothetical protein
VRFAAVWMRFNVAKRVGNERHLLSFFVVIVGKCGSGQEKSE